MMNDEEIEQKQETTEYEKEFVPDLPPNMPIFISVSYSNAMDGGDYKITVGGNFFDNLKDVYKYTEKLIDRMNNERKKHKKQKKNIGNIRSYG